MAKRNLDSKGGAGKRLSNGLVALSSVAVLAVYSAGYVRTRAAAARFEVPAAARRGGHRAAAAAPGPLASDATVSTSALIASPPAPDIEAAVKPAEATPSAAQPAPPVEPSRTPASAIAPPAQLPPSSTMMASVPAPVSAPTHEPPASAAVPAPAPAATPTPAPPAAPVRSTSPVDAPAVPKTASPSPAAPLYTDAPPVDPSEQPFVFHGAFKKDGTFLGWGSSRHGDIQASVQIENGRIVSAVIAQCLTRYSCDVIDKLPPQVVKRQSADVDYVSGATESADAFYDAIVDALSKAK